MFDWWHYLMEHIGRNATNYFMYQWVGLWCFPGITQLGPATPASGSDLPINIRPGFLCTDEASGLVGRAGI